MAQTPDGYLWLGTQAGLIRFDGLKFRLFDSSNTEALKASMITSLLCDRRGALWIGTAGGGLARMQEGVIRTWTAADGLSNDFVQALCEDRDGRIWAGTNSGLNLLADGRLVPFAAQAGLQGKEVWALAATPAGALWIGTRGHGLLLLEQGMLTRMTAQEGFSGTQVVSLLADRAGKLWIGTEKGLFLRREGRFAPLAGALALRQMTVAALVEDRAGNLWIGTKEHGVFRYHDDRCEQFSEAQGLPNAWVYSMFEDRDGGLWIGLYVGGLSRLKYGPVLTWTTAEGLGADMVMVVGASHRGGVWAGLSNGQVARFDGERFASYSVRDGLSGRAIQSICEDGDGDLWVGTDQGLMRFAGGVIAPSRRRTYTTADGLPDNWIFAIHADREKRLWVATRNRGLSLLRGTRFVNFTKQDGLADDFVSIMRDRRQGGLWIGTLGGISLYREGRFQNFTARNGLTNDSISALYEDEDGVLWIGTTGGGLNVLAGERIRAVRKKDGLPNETLFQLLDDARGNLWCGSENGIFRLRKSEIQAFLRRERTPLRAVSFGLGEGMRTQTCSGIPGGARSIDGRLWFPTVKGLSMVEPARMESDSFRIPVVIENVDADREPLALSEGIGLAPGVSRLSFHYSGVRLSAPERVRFRYRLEGYDPDWIDAATERQADYTNLSPGTYRFRVMAGDDAGNWTEPGAALTFTKRPWFYQTWWFYALCAVAMAGLIRGGYRIRLRQVQARHAAVLEERTRMARELHDTLVQGYVGIGTMLESALRHLGEAPDLARRQVEVARRVARHSLTESRRAVNDLRSEILADHDLFDAVRQTVAEATARAGIPVRFEVDGRAPRFRPEAEQQALRIVQEAVSNAVRHASPGTITLRMRSLPQRIELRVADDGSGFPIERAFSTMDGHFGLIGMRERAARLGAEFRVESRPGNGTEIFLSVPLMQGKEGPDGADTVPDSSHDRG